MPQFQKLAVTGATGRAGHHAVELLRARGHEVVEISRARGVDVVTGEGLAAALAGVDAVIDSATGSSPDQEQATAFFVASARNLQAAAAEAGVRRIVMVSIIGCDRFTAGYNVAKRAHELALEEGPVPVRILRAAQFHEFLPVMLEWTTRNGTSHVPAFRTQPVAARAVAEELVALATGPEEANGAIPEIAGPRAERLAELAQLLYARRGTGTRVEEVSDLTDPDSARYADGAALPGPQAKLAGPTFAEWLETA